ncbi:MAG: DUF4160 domain-containing protein [Saprospiraceae bacterium]|jgi:hypothetical protein|nr:DUF4160 domain-containing protein [Saprospiraceae bacterium]HRD81317.1 DUF4160 domain-containing protein [Saprospiraceae bacterium]
MPVVHLIDSIKILVYFDDHLPPHFHAQYNEYEMLVVIDSLDIYSGFLPSKQRNKVLEWAEINRDFLWSKWNEFHDN